MTQSTRQLWGTQNRHPGDREALFVAVADALPIETVLYPGSYVDIAASFVFGQHNHWPSPPDFRVTSSHSPQHNRVLG